MRYVFARRVMAALGLLLLPVLAAPARANISIQFDYSFDTSGFFTSHPQAQTLLDDAALSFESRFDNTLLGIAPGSGNTWTAIPFDPTDPNSDLNIANLTVAANTVIVYVGGANISALGLGGPGGFTTSGFGNWNSVVQARGNPGADGSPASQTAFAPWGGSIAFNATATWYFDTDPFTNDVPAGQNDFYSVALHELGHVLGFGTANAWDNQVVGGPGGNFTGNFSTYVSGGMPPELSSDDAHWFPGTMSVVMDSIVAQEAAMDPDLTVGTRKYFTLLDFAGLRDIGWNVAIPEPAAWPLAAGAAASGVILLRRRWATPRRTLQG